MDLWAKIINASGLPECRSIAEHLCSLGNGEITYITRNPIYGEIQKINNIEGLVQKITTINGIINYINPLNGTLQKINPLTGVVTKMDNIKGNIKCQK